MLRQNYLWRPELEVIFRHPMQKYRLEKSREKLHNGRWSGIYRYVRKR
jgi:hypothetical protein